MRQDEEERINIRKRIIVTQQRIEMLEEIIKSMKEDIRRDLKKIKDK